MPPLPTPPEKGWSLPAWQRYNEEVQLCFIRQEAAHYALAMAGEAGECANTVVRLWRLFGPSCGVRETDSATMSFDELKQRRELNTKLESEIADTFVFLLTLCSAFHIDLDAAFTRVYKDKILPRLLEGKHYAHQRR